MRLQAATSRCVWCTPSIQTDNSDTRRRVRRELATAELSVRYACTAVEPVKIKVAILQGHPTRALMDASPGAAMLCVGVDRTETLHRWAGSVRRPRPWLRGPIVPSR